MKEPFGEFRKRMEESNDQLKAIFKKSLCHEVSIRDGAILFIDDMPEQSEVIKKLIEKSEADIPVVACCNIDAAIDYIEEKGQENIRIAVVDIEFHGKEDGFDFLQWVDEYHSDIPIVVSTGHAEYLGKLEKMYPDAQVFIKGKTSISEFSEVLGLNLIDSNLIPKDSNDDSV